MCDPRDNRENKTANPRQSLGSGARNDVLTGNVAFVGNALYGDAFTIQDFVAGSNEVIGVLAPEFSWLPPPERIQRYLVMAQYARWEASSSDAPVRESYLFIAEQWEKFALDLALDSARRLLMDISSKPGPKH